MHLKFFLVCLLYSLYVFAQPVLIGTSDSGTPFKIPSKENQFYGFEIDLMKEICKRAQLDCRFTSVTFKDLFNDLEEGQIDLAIGSIVITPDREEIYLFSLPYLIGGGQYATKVSSSVKDLNDIQGKTVGIEKGTIFKAWITSQFGDTAQVLEYNTLNEVLQALNNDEVEVALFDSGIVQYWLANSSDQLKVVGEPMGAGYGIMANQNHQALIDTINKYLIELENDGTYLKLYRRYF